MNTVANPIEKRNERYGKYVDSVTPKTGTVKSLWHSFWIGGLTCCIAQGIGDIYALIFPNFSEDFDGESEESENPDADEDLDESEDQDESEGMGMSMGM